MGIDNRFVANNEYLKHREQGIKIAKTSIARPWFSKAQTIISDWFSATLGHAEILGADDKKITAYIIGLDTIDLPGNKLNDIAGFPTEGTNAVNTILQNGHTKHIEIEWLVGCALADAALKHSGRPEVTIAAWSLMMGDFAPKAFQDQLQISWNSGASLVTTRACEEIARQVSAKPETFIIYSDQKKQFANFLKDWATSKTLYDIWHGRSFSHFYFECSVMGLFKVLRRCDKAYYLNLLERTCVPNIITNEFSLIEVRYDLDEIIELLLLAPACFENGTIKWNGAMSAPFLISTGHGHIVEIAEMAEHEDRNNGTETDAQKLESEIQALFEKLIASILIRQDGVYLALSWLCHLIAHARMYNMRPDQIIDTNAIAIATTAKLISTTWTEPETLEDLYPQFFTIAAQELEEMQAKGIGDLNAMQRPNGTDIFFAFTAIHMEGGNFNAKNLLEMLQCLLIRHDSGASLGLDERYPSLPFNYAARLFLENKTPIATWKAMWSQISNQRRHYRLQWLETSFLMGPSEFLAGIGITIEYWLVSEHHKNPVEALEFWTELFEIALQQLAEYSMSQREFWRSYIFHLFALLPKTLEDLTANDEADQIALKLTCLGGDGDLWIGALSSLKRNHTDICKIDDALRTNHQITLLTLVTDYAEWYRSCRGRNEEGVIEQCKTLIFELKKSPKNRAIA